MDLGDLTNSNRRARRFYSGVTFPSKARPSYLPLLRSRSQPEVRSLGVLLPQRTTRIGKEGLEPPTSTPSIVVVKRRMSGWHSFSELLPGFDQLSANSLDFRLCPVASGKANFPARRLPSGRLIEKEATKVSLDRFWSFLPHLVAAVRGDFGTAEPAGAWIGAFAAFLSSE